MFDLWQESGSMYTFTAYKIIDDMCRLGFWYQVIGLGKFEWNFRHVIFKPILVIDGWGISCEIALIWRSLVFTDDQSTCKDLLAPHYES